MRGQAGLANGAGVDEPVLIFLAPGRRLVERRHLVDFNLFLSLQIGHGGADLGHAVADVAAEAETEDTIDETGQIIIAGIGRFGQVVNRMVQVSGFRTTVLDNNLETIQLMRRFGFKGFFGDPTRPELLHAAGIETARVLVVALGDRDAATKLVAQARHARPDIHIVARAHDRVHVYELYRAGADKIVREMFDSSLRAGRYVLENIGLTEFEAAEQVRMFFQHDRAGLRELAKLWVPGLPVSENPDYVARAREINAELETALVGALDKQRSGSEDTAAE